MNRLLYLFISLLSVGCLITACDDMSDEPQAYPEQFCIFLRKAVRPL